jgi:hypothetical protein
LARVKQGADAESGGVAMRLTGTGAPPLAGTGGGGLLLLTQPDNDPASSNNATAVFTRMVSLPGYTSKTIAVDHSRLSATPFSRLLDFAHRVAEDATGMLSCMETAP